MYFSEVAVYLLVLGDYVLLLRVALYHDTLVLNPALGEVADTLDDVVVGG